MKTTKHLLLCIAATLAVSYSIYTTVRIRQLEARLHEREPVQLAKRHLIYAFDDSFMQHFGQPGVAAVDRAVGRGLTSPDEIAREVTQERGFRYDLR